MADLTPEEEELAFLARIDAEMAGETAGAKAQETKVLAEADESMRDAPSSLSSALAGGLQGLTAGFSDELDAFTDAMFRGMGPPDDPREAPGPDLDMLTAAKRARLQRHRDTNPWSYGGGEMAGMVGLGALTGGAGTAGRAAAQGAVQGLGRGEDAQSRLLGGAIGAGGGVAGQQAARGVSALAQRGLSKLRPPTDVAAARWTVAPPTKAEMAIGGLRPTGPTPPPRPSPPSYRIEPGPPIPPAPAPPAAAMPQQPMIPADTQSGVLMAVASGVSDPAKVGRMVGLTKNQARAQLTALQLQGGLVSMKGRYFPTGSIMPRMMPRPGSIPRQPIPQPTGPGPIPGAPPVGSQVMQMIPEPTPPPLPAEIPTPLPAQHLPARQAGARAVQRGLESSPGLPDAERGAVRQLQETLASPPEGFGQAITRGFMDAGSGRATTALGTGGARGLQQGLSARALEGAIGSIRAAMAHPAGREIARETLLRIGPSVRGGPYAGEAAALAAGLAEDDPLFAAQWSASAQ